MIVCHCHVVSDRRIRELAADGALTVADVANACDAGRDCGSCVGVVRHLLDRAEVPVAVAV